MNHKIRNWLRIIFGIFLIWYAIFDYFHNAAYYIEFLKILHHQIELSERGWEFYYFLHDFPFLFWLIKVVKIGVGMSLIFNFFVPLSLIVYAPLALNEILFTFFVSPNIWYFTVPVMLVLILLKTWYIDCYKPLLKIR